ncbi:MAG: endolytic transglycosylase MltG [Herminiimonas sp.]|nr:endolytic transglycosylase MltG [Herminiimonas sp.]
MKKLILTILLVGLLSCAAIALWATRPITPLGAAPIDFTIEPGSGVRGTTQQIAAAGVPVEPMLLESLARASGRSARLKAGSYTLKPGTSPQRLVEQLVRGEFAQEALPIIEGWTFAQMRAAVAAHPALKHESVAWTEQELLAKVAPEFKMAEGLFFPDTYRFAKGSSDLQVYRQAYALMQKKLDDAWRRRASDLPYQTPYQALIMASIVEKETGQRAERAQIASVFVNRLRRGMLLQTDPTVIYGMGARYQGQIRKRDLQTDTPYNTYTRGGLPPTPIALPGEASLKATLNPAKGDALYFVSRGDGTSKFSDNLNDHNRAVNQFQR